MSGLTGVAGEIEKEAAVAGEWVEKEAGLIERRVTSTVAYHSAERIAEKIDGWVETLDSGLDADVRKAYGEAAKLIKGLF